MCWCQLSYQKTNICVRGAKSRVPLIYDFNDNTRCHLFVYFLPYFKLLKLFVPVDNFEYAFKIDFLKIIPNTHVK